MGFQKGYIPWNKGKHHSEEHKRKISLGNMGRVGYWKGKNKPLSEETKRKISIANKGKKRSEEQRKNNGIAHKGIKASEETKKKRSESAKRSGVGKWMKGRKLSDATRAKMKLRIGPKGCNWRGGLTLEAEKIRKSDEYKTWRRDVFIRDEFTCQECGHKYIDIRAHHIKSFADYPDLRFIVNNGKTVCKKCHKMIHGGIG